MEKCVKRRIVLFSAFAIVIAAGGFMLALRVFAAPAGQLRVAVVDAYTLAPIEGAYVIAVECGRGERVASGFALITDVPCEVKQEGASYGETTLIAYADGYMPSILLRAHVYPKRLREGPTVYMFPMGSEEDFSVTVFSEAPDEYLMEELAAKNRPKR